MYTPKGNFAWYELMTTDTAAAGDFYSKVVGWTTQSVSSPEMPYTTFNINGVGIAGLLSHSASSAPPSWIGYIHVDDCDAHAEKIVAAGGKLYRPPTDVPGMLRFAVVADPQGAAFVIFTPNPAMPTPANRPVPPAPGTIGWHELYAADLESAWQFYSTHFGWEKINDMDMGPAGIYRIFGEKAGSEAEKQIGGMMTKDSHIPAPYWSFYFHVDNINSAIERIKSGGGTVLMGPHQVPGDLWIVMATDPQGARFALVSPNK